MDLSKSGFADSQTLHTVRSWAHQGNREAMYTAWLDAPRLRKAVKLAACVLLVWYILPFPKTWHASQRTTADASFEHLNVTGFVNTGTPANMSCEGLRYNTTIAVQNSTHLQDDIKAIADSLESHPMVEYKDEHKKAGKGIDFHWSRLAGSSVWVEEFGVYFSITRVIFSTDGVTNWPTISFVRAQLYDENWNEVRRSLTWKGRTLSFPQVLEIPVDYEKGGRVYGPEDARITIEPGVGAEPVIVFNMISKESEWKRAMHIYRPFSQELRILTIRGRPRLDREKNWAPFFDGDGKTPSRHIMFVYLPSPLQILWCSLDTGNCDVAYTQTLEERIVGTAEHKGEPHTLKGGTNFVMIRPGVWLGIPRTHIDIKCGWPNPVYRPMFMVLMSAGDSYYVHYTSGAVDFGGAVLSLEQQKDPCHAGRILIPNSIARLDGNSLTITFSVDDRTNQAAKVIMDMDWQVIPPTSVSDRVNMTVVGNEVMRCGIDSHLNNTQALAATWYAEHPDQKP